MIVLFSWRYARVNVNVICASMIYFKIKQNFEVLFFIDLRTLNPLTIFIDFRTLNPL
jgi:hypothetical protein